MFPLSRTGTGLYSGATSSSDGGDMGRISAQAGPAVDVPAGDPQLWQTLRSQLLPRLRAHGLFVYQRDRDAPDAPWQAAVTLYQDGYDAALMHRYGEYYQHRNVWAANEAVMRPGVAVTSSMLYPDADLKKTEYYDGWLRPNDIFYALGGVVLEDARRQVKLSVVRSERAAAFQQDDLDTMALLMPHLRMQLTLDEQLRATRLLADAGVAALDQLHLGVFLLGPGGTVVHANAAGAAQLARRVPLRSDGLRLASDVPEFHQALEAPPQPEPVRVAHGATTLTLYTPAVPRQGESRITRVVLVSDREGDAQQFCAERNFTRAEQQVFALLLQGRSAKEISLLRQSAYNTVRSQIASILVKARCRSQRELLALFPA